MRVSKLFQKPIINCKRNLGGQALRGSAAGLLLVPALLTVVIMGGTLLGYRLVSINGTSMEPALRHGDTLWVKHLDADEVRVGDIATLPHSGEGFITHRVVGAKLMPEGSYLMVTKGDANQFAEIWEISTDATVAVTFARARYAGYALEVLDSFLARILLIGAGVATIIAMWLRRRRMKPGVKNPVIQD